MRNDIPIDCKWYLDNQVKEPVKRMLKLVIAPEALRDLLTGDHTRVARLAAPRLGIGMWVERRNSCVICKAPLMGDASSKAYCRCCAGDRERVLQAYQTTITKHRENERRFHAYWTNCSTCVSKPPTNQPLCREIKCRNKDCKHYYPREKAKHDLAKTGQLMQREWDW